MEVKQATRRLVEDQRVGLVDLSRRIHAHPELAFEEESASRWLAEYLGRFRFQIEERYCDLPTAVVARAGTGSLRVALCAEYDALPGIGHACGHNLIAAAAAGAGVALARVADYLDITVIVLGTPGEELYSLPAVPDDVSGPGKVLLLERGAFEGIHVALMAHPAPVDIAVAPSKAAARFHASYRLRDLADTLRLADPADLRCLEEALTLAQAGVAALAKQAPPSARISTVRTAGCWSTHMSADAEMGVLAASLRELEDLKRGLWRCFEAGAEATGSRLEIIDHLPYAELRADAALVATYRANAEALGRAFPDLGTLLERVSVATDIGNVSHRIPAIHPYFGIGATVMNHHPDFTRCAAADVAHDAMIDAASALVWTAIDAATRPDLMSRFLHGISS